VNDFNAAYEARGHPHVSSSGFRLDSCGNRRFFFRSHEPMHSIIWCHGVLNFTSDAVYDQATWALKLKGSEIMLPQN
jgi:hypothetical protein